MERTSNTPTPEAASLQVSVTPCLEENEIVDLVTGTLAPDAAREADAHIDKCASCRLVLIELARVFELKASNISAPPELDVSADPGGGSDASVLGLAIPAMARGTEIGRYVVLEFLGAGAMGVVFSAYDPELDRKVALKLLRTAARAKGSKERLVREARAVARIAHPNVVVVHDVGEHESSVFMAMEFVEGGTLATWLKDQPRTQTAILEAFVQAGRGLEAAHAAGIVHRDFKPLNVLMGDERPRVTDFGLAFGEARRPTELELMSVEQALSDETLTQTGMMVGTPAYMAPEQFQRANVDARSDQFSFCVALYEALCEARPFAGRTVSELAANVVAGRLAEPHRLDALPRRVRLVLERGLQPDPAGRFSSISALLTQLKAVQGGLWRGRMMLTTGSLLGIAGLGYGLWVAPAAAETGCDDPQQHIAATWDAGRRERLETTLLGDDAGSAYTATAVTQVLTALDHRVEEWEQSHATVCAADPSPAQLRCLEGIRGRLDAVVGALERGGPQTLNDAAPTVLRVPPPFRCESNPRFLGEPLAASTSGPTASGWQAQRLASSLVELGAYARAVDEGASALAVASEHKDLALEARSGLVLGRAQVALAQFEDARETLEAAFSASWAAHDGPAALEIAAQLVMLIGKEQGNEELAEVWLDLGSVAAARAEGPSLEEASFWEAAGVLAQSRNTWTDAAALHERALSMRRELLPPNHPDVVSSLHHISGIKYEVGDVAGGLERSQDVLQRRLEALGPDHPHVAFARNTLAVGLIYRGDVDEGIEQLELALEAGVRAHGQYNPSLAAMRSNLAAALNRKGEHARAMKIYTDVLRTWETARGADDPSIGLAHYNLGSTAQKIGDFEVAQTHYEQAVALWEDQLGPDHPRMATGLSGLSSVLSLQGDCKGALPHVQRAAAIMGALDPSPRSVQTYYNLSRTQMCLGDLDDANVAADKTLAHGRAVFGDDNPSLTPVLIHVARLRVMSGNLDTARSIASQAVKLAQSDADLAVSKLALAEALLGSDPTRARELAQAAKQHLPPASRFDKTRADLNTFLDGLEP